MAKLSNIFENVDGKNSHESKKRKYLAKKLLESYMLSEGVKTKGYSYNEVEQKIYSEAIKYKTMNEAVKFVEEIAEEALNEGGFLSKVGGALKAAKDWVVDKAKKIVGKVVSFFKGEKAAEIKTHFDKFQATIQPAVDKLKNAKPELAGGTGGETAAIGNSSTGTAGALTTTESLMFTESLSYLFESDELGGENDIDKNLNDDTENEDDTNVNSKLAYIVGLLASKKELPQPKKTGSSQKNLRFFKITKSGVNLSLWVGPEAGTMKVILTYLGASNKMFINIDPEILSSQLEMVFIYDLLNAVKANDTFNGGGKLSTSIKSITQAGKKITIDGIPVIKLIPGKLLILPVGGKAGQPMKLKKAVGQQQFQEVFAKVKDEENHEVETDAAGNIQKKEGETDEDFAKRVAVRDAAMDAKDDAALGADETAEGVDADHLDQLLKNITRYFGITEEQINQSKIDDAVGNLAEAGRLTIDNINETNQRLGDLLDYFKTKDGGDISPEDLKTLNEDFNAIVNVAYILAFENSLAKTPEDKKADLKARMIKLVNELDKISKPYGVSVKMNDDWNSSFEGIGDAQSASEKWKNGGKEEAQGGFANEPKVGAFGETKPAEEQTTAGYETDDILNETYKLIFGGPNETPTLFFMGGAEGEEISMADAKNFFTKVESFIKSDSGATNQKAINSMFKGKSPEEVNKAFKEILANDEVYPTSPKEEVKPEDMKDETGAVDPKKWVDAMVKNSGAKNVSSGLLSTLGIDNASLWKNFAVFADKNQNKLPNILLATTFGGDHAPMSDNEFLAYATQLDTMLGYVESNIGGTLDSQGYPEGAFKTFVGTASTAAAVLNQNINEATLATTDIAKDVAKKQEKEAQAQLAADEKAAYDAKDPYEAFLKNIESENPELLKVMQEKLDESSLKVWAKELTKLSKNGVTYDNMKTYIETAPAFFNRKNLKAKFKYLTDLSSKNIPVEIRVKALAAMQDLDVSDSFDSIEVFSNIDGEPYKTGNFAENDDAKNAIFLKSKF